MGTKAMILGGVLAMAVWQAHGGVSIRETELLMLSLNETRQPRWAIQTETYEAAVFADGQLQIASGGERFIDGCWLLRGDQMLTQGQGAKVGETSIELREGAPPRGDIDALLDPEAAAVPALKLPDLPGMRLDFKPASIEITLLSLKKQKPRDPKQQPEAYSLFLGLGGAMAGVSNLLTGVDDALPTRRVRQFHPFAFGNQLGHYWPDVALLATNGSVVELRGIGGVDAARGLRALPDATRANLTRGVIVVPDPKEESHLTLSFRPPPVPSLALAAIPAFTSQSVRPNGLFPAGEPVRYTLTFEPSASPGRYRLEWTLVDHIQQPLGAGQTEFDLGPDKPREIPVDLVPSEGPLGYAYARAWLRRIDVPSVRRHTTFEFGRCRFEHDLLADHRSFDEELYWYNLLGFRGIRRADSVESIWTRHRDKANPENIDWEGYRTELERQTAFCRRGTLRTVVMLMEGQGGKEVDDAFRKRFGTPETAPSQVPADAPPIALEDRNDPAAPPPPDPDRAWKQRRGEARARWLREWAAVAGPLGIRAWEPTNEPDLRMSPQTYLDSLLKPIYPAIKAGDPQANFLGGSCCGLEKHDWMHRLYELGGQAFFDGISFHPYTGAGFQRVYRMHLGQWFDLFRAFNDDPAQGVYMTEAANHRGWGYNDYVYERNQARRESHAHTGLHLMLNAEAMGIPRDRVYIFYAREHGYNDFYLLRRDSPTPSAVAFQVMNECLRDARFVRELPLPGRDHYFQLYQDATRTVAALFTGGDRVELEILTDAASVERTDCMGNRLVLNPVNGRVQVAFDNFPVFLKTDPGKRLAPAYDGLAVAPNLALAPLGATVHVSGSPNPKAAPPEMLLTGDWTGFAGNRWIEGDDGIDHFPDMIEIRLPAAAVVDTVYIYHEYGGWQRTLRDFDIEVFDGGVWRTVERVRGNYYSEATRHRFEPVTTDRVRVVVHAVNTSLFGEVNWIKRQTALRGLAVHAAPQRPARVFFGETRLGKPSLARGGRLPLALRVVNAGSAPFTGELRLTLPEGLAAASAAVTVPGGGETTLSVEVAATPGAAGGLKTLLAGVFEGDTLVSSDYETRWVMIDE